MSAETFEIIDGIRRAKAHEFLGKQSIPAEISDAAGNLLEIREVPLEALRVNAKSSIDVSTLKNWERFMHTLDLVKAGSPTPPIIVRAGNRGCKLAEIWLDKTGTAEGD